MVFSRRRGLGLRPVKSLKHIVDTATAVVTTVPSVVPLVISVASPTISGVADVEDGSTVSSIYLRVETLATAVYAGVPRIYMIVFKNPGNNLTVPNASAAGADDAKRYIIHQEMQMVAPLADFAFPRTMFQGVIKIPPRLKRFGYNDRLVVEFQHGSGETTGIANVCVQCIYKEFR